MRGRPTKYSPKLVAEICGRIVAGESLKAICRDENMPVASTVFLWLGKHSHFSDQYARATQARADAFAEEIIEIADTPLEGVRVEEGADYSKTIREDMLGHRRLQVDTRKWLMARMAPKKYGDKIEQTHRGDAEAPLVVELIAGTSDDAGHEAQSPDQASA